jgi:hypothetical protein
MDTFAATHWGYVGLLVIAIGAVVLSPFLIVPFGSARAIADTNSDDSRKLVFATGSLSPFR